MINMNNDNKACFKINRIVNEKSVEIQILNPSYVNVNGNWHSQFEYMVPNCHEKYMTGFHREGEFHRTEKTLEFYGGIHINENKIDTIQLDDSEFSEINKIFTEIFDKLQNEIENERRRQLEEDKKEPIILPAYIESGSYLVDKELAYVRKANQKEKSGFVYPYYLQLYIVCETIIEIENIQDVKDQIDKIRELKTEEGHLGCESRVKIITEELKDEIINKIKKCQEERLKKEEEQLKKQKYTEQQELIERNLKIKQAKETNQKIELDSWMEPCNSKYEDCSWDFVYLFAMPDGSLKTERFHTC